jgi:RNA polymerase sigma factor (sigma-70 family)
MEHLRHFRLLDEHGKPLDPRIENVLKRLLRKFLKRFPSLRDDLTVTEVFEEAGRKIANREREAGRIERLHGYAWVTLRNTGTSWLRRGSSQLAQHTLSADDSDTALASMPTTCGTPEEIERSILMEEVMAHLSPEERLVFFLKIKAGFSSEQVARFRGTSVNAVDIVFSRTKRKISRLLSVQQYGRHSGELMGRSGRTRPTQTSLDHTGSETRDDETTRRAGSPSLSVGR